MKNISILLLYLIPFYSFSQIIYVDSSAVSGQNTGVDWVNAYTDLQDALSIATEGNEIWVAEGTYFPTNDTNREIYFELPSNVVLLGGFEGTETNSDQRDWELNKTILSGDIGVEGDSLDNSYTVLFAIDVSSETKLDGFTIEKGNANSNSITDPLTGPNRSGGGFYLRGQTESIRMVIRNCIFQNNNALYYGGGVYLINTYFGSMNASFINCKFYYNSAGIGGGLGKYGGGEPAYENRIQNCIFSNNISANGGAIYTLNTYGANTFYIINSCFSNNIASSGGAISIQHEIQDTSTFNIVECTFEENEAENGGAINLANFFISDYSLNVNKTRFIKNNAEFAGGCINSDDGNIKVNNCLFTKNMSNSAGACISIFGSPTVPLYLDINNSTFFSNSAGNIGGGIRVYQAFVNINNTLLIDNTAGNGGNIAITGNSDSTEIYMNNCLTDFDSCLGGIYVSPQSAGNIECNAMIYNQDPLFKDAANMDFSLLACSPAIDAGDNAYVSELEDVAGNDRIINGTVDIGAYETSSTFLSLDTLIDAVCYGGNSGAIGFSYNGQSPFVTVWDNGMTTGTSTDSLAAGVYSLTVTDANDCSDVIEFEIEDADSTTVTFTTQKVTCPDGIDGAAVLTIHGGTPDYFVSWSSGEIGFEANLLMGGWNVVTVVDANNCELIDSVFIEEPEAIFAYGDITNATTNNTSDGAIEIFNITGGTPPFQLEWNTGDTTALIENLSPNAYTVTITDANGCVSTQGFLVSFNTGVVQVEDGEIIILPNPVERSGDLKIELKNISVPLNIKFYNAVGSLIQQKIVAIPTNQIQLNAPENTGVYFLSIFQEGKFGIVKKIVVY